MLFSIVGDFGSGKTLLMVLLAVSSKRQVLGNFSLKLDNYTKIDPMDLQNLGFNKLVLLDELYTWLDARVSSSFLNRYISYILMQCRHRTIDVYGTLQLFGMADLRFRAMVNRIIKCSRKYKKGVNKEFWDFKYEIMNTYTGEVVTKKLTYEKAKLYFPLYDSYEIMVSEDNHSLELEVLKKYPRKLYEKLTEIAMEIKNNGEKITHSSVQMNLLKRGYSLGFERLVYSHLKELED